MNVLDYLAGDERFIDIRKRRPQHRTLERIDQVTEGARKAAADERKKEEEKFDKVIDEEQKNLDKRIKDLEEKLKKEEINTIDVAQRVAISLKEGQQRIEAEKERMKRDRDKKINEVETDLSIQIRKVQDRYKLWAVILPPIPPLLVAVGVFITRRSREREGVARSRLRP
jgi:ABC-2 type transport system permease protein